MQTKMTLDDIKKILKDGGIESCAWEARLLFSHFEGVDGAHLVGQNPKVTSDALIGAAHRRADGYPLQYIIGEVEFYREKYKVGEGCLIPRSDTEILVDFAVKSLPRGAIFADLCTGSGCIAVSVLANRPDLTAIAADISPDAIKIARENAKINGVEGRIKFLCADLLNEKIDTAGVSFILSNPPYINDKDMKSLARELSYEPQIALRGGSDGGVFYRKIVEDYHREADMIFEIGYDQRTLITDIAERHGMDVKIIPDLSGNDRVAVLSRRTVPSV